MSLPDINNIRFNDNRLEVWFDLFPEACRYRVSIRKKLGEFLFPEQDIFFRTVGDNGIFRLTELRDIKEDMSTDEYTLYMTAIDRSNTNCASNTFILQLTSMGAGRVNAEFKRKNDTIDLDDGDSDDDRTARRRFLKWTGIIAGIIITLLVIAGLYWMWHRHNGIDSRIKSALKTNSAPGAIIGAKTTNTVTAPTNTNTVPVTTVPTLSAALPAGPLATNNVAATIPAATNDDIKIAESMRETVIAMNAANALRQEKEGLRRQIDELKLAAEAREIQILTNNNPGSSGSVHRNSPSIVGSNNVINNQVINIGNSNSNIIINPINQRPEFRHNDGDGSIKILPPPPCTSFHRTAYEVPVVEVLPKYDATWNTIGWHWTPGPENGTENRRIAGGQDGWMARDHPPTPIQYYYGPHY